jgi:suppressor for copper-sensitivity B
MIRPLAFLVLLIASLPAVAAVSPAVEGHALTARLVTAEDGVTGRTLSAGLDVTLAEGWKTYWRSPGEVGLPPALDWSGSVNVADVTLAYPAPDRFEAFEIQNVGYGGEVLFPLTVALEDPAAPARLAVRADLLVCADICIPETIDLALDLPVGGGIDAVSAARLADWIARVPGGPETGIALDRVHLDDAALTLTATSDRPFAAPDIFPEHGPAASFDAPVTELSADGRTLWARIPVLSPGEGPLDVTLTDGTGTASVRAATLTAQLAPAPPARPASGPALWWVLGAAMLGGLILNLMPCVLPVLSIKLASALQARDRPLARVRAGFLASAAGAVAFFVALAGLLVALRGAGVAVGWGIQFQQPVFLALVIGVMTLFAANLLGAFEVGLSQDAMTGMSRAGARGGWGGDFATGAFAALMATPCSAPFIGTAVTYALTSGPGHVVAVFAAMGFGLAVPYLLVALRPGLVRRLPRPGRWMGTLRAGLGLLMLIAVAWLLTVLAGAAGQRLALVAAALVAALFLALRIGRRALPIGAAGLGALALAAVLLPAGPAAATDPAGPWQPFAPDRIAREVVAGRTVLVDVTADWCLTCQANKRLVLDRGAVAEALPGIVALRADWTRPDPVIAEYLRGHDRFGIPFNAVYGPGAPDGIALPELLTESLVLDALVRAGGD